MKHIIIISRIMIIIKGILIIEIIVYGIDNINTINLNDNKTDRNKY